MKKAISTLLALSLTLSLSLVPASALTLEEAKKLLADLYVDGVSDEILELDSLDAILEAIGDPYTFYMTAEQYQNFNKSVNGDSVTGIGASVESAYDGGYRIMSVLPNSPALEAGIQPGDLLAAVDGVPTSPEVDPRTLIAGEEGTPVTIQVNRNGQLLEFTLIRRKVDIPIVTYSLEDGAGFIVCTSFGASTADTFQEAIEALEQKTNVWIVDLRSNPGGGSDATALTSSLFTGGGIMLYYRDGAGNYQYTYTSENFPDMTDKPVIVLTSEHSASGSELFAGDIRAYKAGIALGQRTFGKGTAQLVLEKSNCDYMVDGEAMKITAYRFFSPDGATNHIIGVLPTLLISPENTEKAALLLTCGFSPYPENHLKIEIAGQTFCVNLYNALKEENIPALTELLEALPPSTELRCSTGKNWDECEPMTPAAAAKELGLSFTSRSLPDTADSPYAREIDTLTTYRILAGYTDGNFHPADPVTRAQFCTMVASALDLPAPESRRTAFSDVPDGSWFAGPVYAMADMGFVSGYSDGRFGPNDVVSYQEMVTILSRVAAWTSIDGDTLSQEPILAEEGLSVSNFALWAQAPARNLKRLDALLDGPAPDDLGTREMAAALLCRLMESTHLIWN